ncbi:MAG: glycosyltransferase family 2 protein [Anaerolineales bacterium]|nr:glycosyltransferase family 2 protein [Anaerolineales bacterium]
MIIPAFNKREVLEETLRSLEHQSLPGGITYEVVVVDDGSTDGTREWLLTYQPAYTCSVLTQVNRGAGAARNHGARQARGEVLLFLDADIIASPDLLAAHWSAHQGEGCFLVMGRVTPWEANRGCPTYQIFGKVYDLGVKSNKLAYPQVLTQNLSIKAVDFLRLGRFDETLLWGEDTDFSYRASRAGFEFFYEPSALGYHNHVLALSQICQKVQRDHEYLGILFKKYPEMVRDLDYLKDKLPIDWGGDAFGVMTHKAAYTFLALPPLRAGAHLITMLMERYYPSPRLLRFLVWKVIGFYQYAGLRQGMRRYGWKPYYEITPGNRH